MATQVTWAAAMLVALLGCDSGRDQAGRDNSDPAHVPRHLLETGQKLESLDSLVEALRCYDSCVALTQSPPGEVQVLQGCLAARAHLHLELDLYARAESDARAALKLIQESGGTPAERATLWLILAQTFERERRLPAADSASDSALSITSALSPPDSALHAQALVTRGRTLVHLNRATEAESLFALAVAANTGDERAHRRLEAQSLLGWSMVRQGHFDRAEPVLLRAYSDLSGKLGAEDPLVRQAAGRLSELYDRWQKPDLFAHYQALATHKDSTEAAE